jgi:hypothetical protein
VTAISTNEGSDLLWGNKTGSHSTINFTPTLPIKHSLKEKEEKTKRHAPSLKALMYQVNYPFWSPIRKPEIKLPLAQSGRHALYW